MGEVEVFQEEYGFEEDEEEDNSCVVGDGGENIVKFFVVYVKYWVYEISYGKYDSKYICIDGDGSESDN